MYALLSLMMTAIGTQAQESPQVLLDFIDDIEVSVGTAVSVKAQFSSIGPDEYINSFDIEFTLDGNTEARHIDVVSPQEDITVSVIGKDCQFSIPVATFESVGKHEALLKITKLNDVEITKNRGSAKCDFSITVLSPGYPRNVAIEEYTGVWCGYCPSGWVALEAMNRIFGDRVVSIAYHSNDIMTCELSYPEYVISLPYMRLNRTDIVNVTNVEEIIRKRLEVDARAKIEVTAEWATPAGVSVNVSAKVESADAVGADGYRIAYAILHNDMRGTGSEWLQEDYGQRSLPSYPEWDYLGGYLWYNDVLFDGTVMTGLENSVPALQPMQVYEHEYQINLEGHSRPILQNKKNLTVVALLVSKDNTIVNASKCEIHADPSWPLDGEIGADVGKVDYQYLDCDISSEAGRNADQVHYYTLDGKEVRGIPSPGIYLRRQGSKVTKTVVSGNN